MLFFKKDFLLSDSPYANELVAKKTSWKPLNDNVMPTQGLKLVEVNKDRLEFRITIFDRLFYMLFIVVGIGILVYAVKAFFSSAFDVVLLALVVGISFLFAGVHMYKRHSCPLVFDAVKKIYFEDDKEYEFHRTVPFDKIYALQLLSYYKSANSSDDTSSYWCDLNLVLNDGSRVYVCSYNGQHKRLERYATKIAKLISKPVWNAL